jgi:signal transduction histidine kinase
LAVAALGLLLVPVCGVLVRWITAGEIAAMRFVLRPRGEVAATPVAPLAAPGFGPSFELHVSLSLLAGLVVTIIWLATGMGYFWPIWVWFGLAVALSLHGVGVRAWAARRDQDRSFRVKVEFCALVAGYQWVIWALAGFGYVWPIWPMLGMGTVLALRALFLYGDRLPWMDRKELVERVDVLTRTRQGALDVQAAELRRIERDLHDGAQARLVALSMRLGRAEERLADQPEIAALVREAREDAGAAIGELRDLARGIAPPILADRGLTAAIEALARRSAIGVTIDADPDRRPLPVVETAAYFVVAESLTNVAKHAGGAAAHVRVTLDRDDVLVLEIADEGPGGANPAGSGLTGLRSRVEALDGRLTVVSPVGGGTTVRAELPCGR